MKTNQTNKHILSLTLGLGLAVSAGAASARAADYLFTIIDHPLGIKGTTAQGINAAGVVIGFYWDANGIAHGYRLTQGVFEAIDHPGANSTNLSTGTFPIGVNDAGTVVGYYVATNRYHGFILQNGTYTALDYSLARETTTYGISSTGEVVGFYRNDDGYGHGFRFKDGVFTTIDNPLGADPDCVEYEPHGVNASKVVAGVYYDNCYDPYQNAYLLKDGVYTTINHPNTLAACFAVGINDSGTVVGFYNTGVTTNNFPIYQGYVLKDGIYDTNIVHPLFPNYNTNPSGINAGGQVVGVLQLRSFPTVIHGFIATPVANPPQELRLSIGRTGDTLQLTATGTTNSQWRLEFRDALIGTNAWQPLTNITLGASPFVLDQPLASSSRFYRGVSLP